MTDETQIPQVDPGTNPDPNLPPNTVFNSPHEYAVGEEVKLQDGRAGKIISIQDSQYIVRVAADIPCTDADFVDG